MHQIAKKLSPVADGDRTQELFEEHKQSIYVRTDMLFVWLMPLQWLAGVGFALWVSPRVWAGETSTVHPHVWAALFLGAAITFWPVFCAVKWPGEQSTRYQIAIAQMLMSALLIHLCGGRIETHFHVFGSLAFIACYRDWRALVVASAVVAADHFLRGVYFPLSAFGVLTASPYRWLEHAAWVVFEDVFLLIAIRQSVNEMFAIAQRQASLEAVNASIERTVDERTAELTQEIAERKNAQAETERMHKLLLDASRQAGMAEVATNVIHNVGNVLNSVNVSQSVISDSVRKLKIDSVAKTADLMKEHAADLGEFLTADPNGRKVPGFLGKLAAKLFQDQEAILAELEVLGRNIGHIKEIIVVQQNHARAGGVCESLPISGLVENALQINSAMLSRYGIEITRDYGEIPPALVEKHKVMQILINLINNAKHALVDGGGDDRRMIVRTTLADGCLAVSVSDNGVGIPEENLTRIFLHGFTTKKDGHGFGLHSGVLAAREMGGSLSVESAGSGKGATFTLRIPFRSEVDGHNKIPAMVDTPDRSQERGLFVKSGLNGHTRGIPPIDAESIQALRELASGENSGVLRELIDTFLETAPKTLLEAKEALSRHCAESLARAAHQLSGSCSNFGAKPMQELSGQLEVLARSSDFANSPEANSRAGELLAALRGELIEVKAALWKYRNNE